MCRTCGYASRGKVEGSLGCRPIETKDETGVDGHQTSRWSRRNGTTNSSKSPESVGLMKFASKPGNGFMESPARFVTVVWYLWRAMIFEVNHLSPVSLRLASVGLGERTVQRGMLSNSGVGRNVSRVQGLIRSVLGVFELGLHLGNAVPEPICFLSRPSLLFFQFLVMLPNHLFRIHFSLDCISAICFSNISAFSRTLLLNSHDSTPSNSFTSSNLSSGFVPNPFDRSFLPYAAIRP